MADYALTKLNKLIKKIHGDKVRTYTTIYDALMRLTLE